MLFGPQKHSRLCFRRRPIYHSSLGPPLVSQCCKLLPWAELVVVTPRLTLLFGKRCHQVQRVIDAICHLHGFSRALTKIAFTFATVVYCQWSISCHTIPYTSKFSKIRHNRKPSLLATRQFCFDLLDLWPIHDREALFEMIPQVATSRWESLNRPPVFKNW